VIPLKIDEVIDFLTRPPTEFSALKMFKLQHQFSDVVETTQLTNDQMPDAIVAVNVRSFHR